MTDEDLRVQQNIQNAAFTEMRKLTKKKINESKQTRWHENLKIKQANNLLYWNPGDQYMFVSLLFQWMNMYFFYQKNPEAIDGVSFVFIQKEYPKSNA